MVAALQIILPTAPLGSRNALTSVADLRAVRSNDATVNTEVLVADQGFFRFDPSSLVADNGTTVIKPTDLTTLQAGRWILVLLSSAPLVAFIQAGPASVVRAVQDKLEEGPISLLDKGADEGLTANNTVPFANTVASLSSSGGAIKAPPGNYRLNAVINQDSVLLDGPLGAVDYDAGVGFHGAFAKGLRPFATGAGTATLQVCTSTDAPTAQACYNVRILFSSISGDDGSGVGAGLGAQADAALLIRGGAEHMLTLGLNLRDGVRCLDMSPSDGFPITCNNHFGLTARNQGAGSTSRTLRLERNDFGGDVDSYFTANHFIGGHLNGPSGGYCVELLGHTSPGIAWQTVCYYCDVKPDKGVKLQGNATIEAWDLTLDPGTTGAVIVETSQNPGGDITSYIRGFIKHGGQKFKWGDGSIIDIPAEVQFFFRGARLFQPYLSDLVYLTSAANPFDQTRYWDWATNSGPLRLNGLKLKVMDATDSTSGITGAFQVVGGIGAGKSIFAGDAVGSANGFYVGSTKVLGAPSSPIADATNAGTAISQLNLLLAAARAQGWLQT